jgi:hypothetical protein
MQTASKTKQAAMAAQMVAVHMMAMKTAARALEGLGADTRTAALAAKLARTFTSQWEALMRHRGKRRTTRQTITVSHQKHVHNHHHQHLHQQGGGSEIEGQACAPSGRREDEDGQISTDASCSALPGPNAPGDLVPMPCQQGEEPVQDTRRGKRLRSAERSR